MIVTYLKHSGFMVESSSAFYIFDYIQGDVRSAIESKKPLYIFSSHIHADHFDKRIFEFAHRIGETKYILSYDIMKKINREKIMKSIIENLDVINIRYDETITFDKVQINTLKSTDEGVAFIVKEDDGVIYHAGDLNWWHWDEESYGWNRNMEINFKREIDKLKGEKIDIAFVPLDPRQEADYYRGMKYFVENVNAKEIYPMHFWEQPEIIDKYKMKYGTENIVDKSFYN